MPPKIPADTWRFISFTHLKSWFFLHYGDEKVSSETIFENMEE